MSKKTILVPYDFSPQSEAALEYAAAFAADTGAELLIVHVLDPSIQDLVGVEPVEALEGLDLALHDVKPKDESIAFSHRLLEGAAADQILTTAKQENAEMIVMGTHGRSGLKMCDSARERLRAKARRCFRSL